MAAPVMRRFESATLRLERGYSQLLKDFKEAIPALPTFEVCFSVHCAARVVRHTL